jgi:tetratricopeptide (TPR) repeat protein
MSQARRFLGLLALSLLPALPALAQATAEVRGTVKDEAGKPVQGAVVTMTNQVNPATHYTDTTDKRGNFWMPGVLYSQAAPIWNLKIELKDWTPIKVKVESRTSNNTLQDTFERALQARGGQTEVRISAFGTLKADFTVKQGAPDAPAGGSDDFQALLGGTAPAAPSAAAAAPGGGGAAAAADPYQQALAKVSGGQLTDSLELFQAAIQAQPTEPERREVYAKVLARLDRIPEAEKEANAVLAMAPDRPETRIMLADIASKKGDFKSAKTHLDEAAKLKPGDPKLLDRQAFVAGQLGDVDGAIAANEAIVAANPQNAEAWIALGDLYNRKKEPAKAEAAFRKVAEIDPANAYKTFFNIGAVIENRANLSADDNRKVVEAFRKSIEIKPDYAVAHRHLAYALLRTGDMAGAKAELEKYLELAPDAKDAAEIRETVKSLGPAPKAKK